MKHLFMPFACLVALLLSGCVDLGPAMGGYGGGYGGGYNPPPRRVDYGGGYRPDYDRYPHTDYDHRRIDHNDHYDDGAAAYRNGQACGREDRRGHHSSNYRRHAGHYNSRTQSQFIRGYNDGYHH